MSERERDKSKLHNHAGVHCESSFNELSPRPWVPGEERAHCQSDTVAKGLMCPPPQPRKSSHFVYNDGYTAPMGYEPEGRAHVRESQDSPLSMPACLRWARALNFLLDDPDGVSLFRRYLQAESRAHADALDFWFACEGLRSHADPEKQQQLVKAIYRRFFVKSSLPIGDDLRRDVTRHLKEFKNSDQRLVTVFDAAQTEVETLISNTTYSNFLKSDVYLQYVQAMQNPGSSSSDISSGSGSSSSSSSVSARDMAQLAQGCGPLPTLHEDSELVTGCSGNHLTPVLEPVRLTKDMLLVTQKRRLDVRPKPAAYAGMFAVRQNGPTLGLGPYHHPHTTYSSYNPVSRQDSELQSLSSHSDARTESDNMSLTDSSLDGMSAYRPSRKQSRQASRQARELAALNRDPCIHQTLIPRTQRIDSKQCQPLEPSKFASILIEKLENVKREQDAQDKLERKLMENECGGGIEMSNSEEQSRTLADAIRLKLNIVDDDCQDILDAHVSRVWSDLTPYRSPCLLSPRAHSPSRRHGTTRVRRKDRDVFSTFSSDSGNVHDFPDTASLGKSKSATRPDQPTSRRSTSKKTLADLTDSGVSVVSDTLPVPLPLPKDSRVVTWLSELDRPTRSYTYTHSELSSGKHSRHRCSSSVERSGGGSEPAQPFVADPNMPPLPPPHTATQLEEARRRLLEDEVRARRSSNQSTLKRSTSGGNSKNSRPSLPVGAPVMSGAMPTPLGNNLGEFPPPATEFTTVVYSFCDEQFPYRTKIPGTKITLKQFKEYLPKKGSYRYFFKTECEELDNQVIQEEISCDTDLLPLWEGKVMAQVKPTE